MMAGAFVYLPEKYQSKGVHKRLLTDLAVLNGEHGRENISCGHGPCDG